MTRYIEWGDYGVSASGYIQRDRVDSTLVDPASPESARALWSALPPDLRLALAKTAPRVAGKWWQNPHTGQWWRSCSSSPENDALCFAEDSTETTKARGNVMGADVAVPRMGCLAEAKAACDAALIAQGYVLDDGSDDHG